MRQCTSEAILVKTFAHELGHGVFGMEHEFFLYPEIQDRDPNLMTWHYTNTNLRKYQWDWIQNPFCMIGGNCGNGSNATMIGVGGDDNFIVNQEVLIETERLDNLYSGIYYYDKYYNLVCVIRISKDYESKYYRLKYYTNSDESNVYKPFDFEYNNYSNCQALTNISAIGFGGSFGVLGGYLKTGVGLEIVMFLNGTDPLVPLTYKYNFVGVDPKMEFNFGYGAYVFAMDYWKGPVSNITPKDYEGIFNTVSLEYEGAALSYIWATTDNKVEQIPMTEYSDRVAWLGISLGIGGSKSPASLKNKIEKLISKAIPWISWASLDYKLAPELSIVEKIELPNKIKELNTNPSYSTTYWKKNVKK
jgi:hypothetical protein